MKFPGNTLYSDSYNLPVTHKKFSRKLVVKDHLRDLDVEVIIILKRIWNETECNLHSYGSEQTLEAFWPPEQAITMAALNKNYFIFCFLIGSAV